MKRSSLLLLFLTLASFFIGTNLQIFGRLVPLTQNPCTSKTTCSSCIQTQKCAWCMQPDFGDRPRCFQPDFRPSTLCPEEFVVNPDNEEFVYKTLALCRAGVVQVIPQYIGLKLRVNEKHSLMVNYEHKLIYSKNNEVISSVEMKDTASGSVIVTYWSKCLGDTRIQTNKCYGLKVGDIVAFETEIVVISCPTDPKERQQQFKIQPVGIGEALTIDLSMICSCDCETKGPTFEENSEVCKGSGTLTCGICDCHDGFFGRNCECNNKDLGESNTDAFKCRPDNTTDVECSGRGNCVCGQCHCNPRENPEEMISGQFCECDNFSCDRHNSVLCSGPEHGYCECGTCKCLNGWEGPACDCSSSVDTCRAPNGEICSGHGSCVCGRCECDVKEDSGTYCERHLLF